MDDVREARRASFGLSLLVAVGWYATVVAAMFVGRSGIPAAPDRDCSVVFSCLTPLAKLGLIVMVGTPILAGLMFCTLVVTGLLARRLPSSVLTGTLSALASVVVIAVASAVWQGVR